LYGALVGYGYRPLRLVAAMAVLWLASGALYWAAAENGAIVPSNPAVYNDPRYADCRGKAGAVERSHWTQCQALAVEHSTFRPFAFSLELSLPFIDLRQRSQWTAVESHRGGMRREVSSAASTWGLATRVLSWYQMLVGWLAIALLALLAMRVSERDH
jgi:hypothetical protein